MSRCAITALISIPMETSTSGLELILDLTSFKKWLRVISTKGVPTILLMDVLPTTLCSMELVFAKPMYL